MRLPDLNQLQTFVTLYELRSVTATAERLHVTQPTVSYTLRQLRERFDDQLFRREGHNLVPTPRATRLFGPVHEALSKLEEIVKVSEGFDPATMADEVAIALTSVGEQTFLPDIMRWLSHRAPNVRLTVERLDSEAVEDSLLRGRVDLAITVSILDSTRLWRTPIRGVQYVAVTSNRHPLPPGGVDMFEGRRFIRVSTRGGHTYPNQVLMEHDLMPQVALTVEEFASVPAILETTDLVTFLPRHVAEVFAGWFPDLQIHGLPWPSRGTPVALYTRRESGLSPVQNWLRRAVLSAVIPSDDLPDS